MELTGNCLKDFWIWYLLPEQVEKYKTGGLIGKDAVKKIRFLSMSFTERYGVYVDFFDSVGINTEVVKNHEGTFNNWVGHSYLGAMPSAKTRPEGRISVIEKANEIYNNK